MRSESQVEEPSDPTAEIVHSLPCSLPSSRKGNDAKISPTSNHPSTHFSLYACILPSICPSVHPSLLWPLSVPKTKHCGDVETNTICFIPHHLEGKPIANRGKCYVHFLTAHSLSQGLAWCQTATALHPFYGVFSSHGYPSVLRTATRPMSAIQHLHMMDEK